MGLSHHVFHISLELLEALVADHAAEPSGRQRLVLLSGPGLLAGAEVTSLVRVCVIGLFGRLLQQCQGLYGQCILIWAFVLAVLGSINLAAFTFTIDFVHFGHGACSPGAI